MHAEAMAWFVGLASAVPEFFRGARVLEVGSLDVNGSVRPLFHGGLYVGVDVSSGKGVDVVMHARHLTFADGYFDAVVSAEAFEHDPYLESTVWNCYRMLRGGGLFAFTAAGPRRAEHGTARREPDSAPWPARDPVHGGFYRNLTPAYVDDVLGHWQWRSRSCDLARGGEDVRFVGVKGEWDG